MADFIPAPGAVVAADTKTVKAYGVAGTVINAGQVVWLDTNSQLRPASGTVQTQAAGVVGIALDSAAGSGQPIAYATAGNVILPGTGGSVMPVGAPYILGTTLPGILNPSSDALPGTVYTTLLGISVSPTNLQLSINPVGARR